MSERPKDWKNGAEMTIHGTKITGTGKHYPLYTISMRLTSLQFDAMITCLDKNAASNDRLREVFSLLEAAELSSDRTYYPYEED